jgi:predicted cupin superfamily sugar epimerase
MDPDIKALIEHYNLQLLSVEGTLFTSTYRSKQETKDGKPCGTAMIGMYCHEPRSVSYFHKLTIDEIWHFYGGDPLQLVLLYPDGTSQDVILGPDHINGQYAQFVIPAGVWQAGQTVEGGKYSLFGCTLAPGFTDDIFTGGTREELLKAYPERERDILLFGLDGGNTNMPKGFAT